jgi:hypothetical protein
MALPGVNNPLTSSLATIGRPQPGTAGGVRPGQPGQPGGVQPGQPGGVRPGATRPAAAPPPGLRTQPSLTAPQPGLSAEAPAGTDPELWQMLTGEERAYFAKAATAGPLTYGRISAGVNALQGNLPAAARGGRLDVRA